jgi:spermidine synthase
MTRGRVLHQERTFFGVYKVSDEENGFRSLSNGTTLHGIQSRNAARRGEPLSYYDRTGPFGELFAAMPHAADPMDVAVVGLGVGTLAAYARPAQRWTFFEIDPAVMRIASNPAYFTYLADCGGRCRVVLGDARLSLARVPPRTFGLIVLDAFSSDAIPMHLITDEAIGLYVSRLAPGGVLAFHISTRHLALNGPLAALASRHGLAARLRRDRRPERAGEGRRPSEWLVMAPAAADFAGPTHLPDSTVAHDLPACTARPTFFGVNATSCPAIAVATVVIPSLTFPSSCSLNQMWFSTS